KAAEAAETAEPAKAAEAADAAAADEATALPEAVEAFADTQPVFADTQPLEPQAEQLPEPPPADKVRVGNRSIDAQLFEIFNAEAADIRRRLDSGLSAWRERRGSRAPEELVRALHSLVGTSRHVGL